MDSASTLLALLQEKRRILAVAESCTGGMIAAAITGIPGSSAVFDRGFVTYSNAAKTDMLGVPASLIEQHGAVSEPVARAMAEGALKHSDATIALSTTGIAGPSGGSAEKPVGLVYIACAMPDKTICTRHVFEGDRHAVRMAAAEKAIEIACHFFA